MEGLQKFTAFTYKTTDGETITATKKNGVVTLVGDKKGTRQMPLDDFWKYFVASAPKLERTPKADTVSFSGEAKEVEKSGKVKKEASSGKKWGVGIASFFIPGLGQAINGEWGKTAGFFFGSAALTALACTTLPFLAIPALGLNIWSVVDAVQNAKAE